MLLLVAALVTTFGAVVLQPVANMYSAPSESADVVSQAIYGANIVVLEEKDGWAKVRTPDEYTGWMRAASFRRADKRYAAEGVVGRVESLFSNLYQEPDVTKHQPVLTVPYETRLEIVSRPAASERWLEARLADGRTAWVQQGDLSFEHGAVAIPELVEISRRFLGLPYLWGGTSTFGYDCSGFTQMLCRRRGVLLPRDAGPQAQWSGLVAVARKELRPGDLLYFGASEKKITHTGMYIGDGRFIHASTHTRPVVQIGRLADAYWTRMLVAARRVK